jgi:hypothetical protein
MSTASAADTIKDLMTRPEAPLSVPLSRRGSGADAAPGAELRHIRAYLARQEEIADDERAAAVLLAQPGVTARPIFHLPGTLRWLVTLGRSPRPREQWVTIPASWFTDCEREIPRRHHLPLSEIER